MNNLNLSSETASGFTAVSDIFIDQYVPSANGEFVKIYLYLLRMLSNKQAQFSVSSMADTFNQTENDVMRALKYWDKLGILSLSFDNNQVLSGIVVKNLTSDNNPSPDDNSRKTDIPQSYGFKEVVDNYETERTSGNVLSMSIDLNSSTSQPIAMEPSRITVSKEKLNELSSNDEFSMLLYVAQTYLGKQLTSRETNSLVYFYDTLHFPTDLIEYLITYCVSKGKTNFRYIEKIALSWADEGINTVEAAKEEVSNHSEAVFKIMKAFGLSNREPGKQEKDIIAKWTDTFCFDTDMIIEACNRTMKATHQPSFEYADSILTRWYSSNIRTQEDVKKADEAFEASRVAKGSTVLKQNTNRFNSFSQHPKKSDDFYNKLLSNNN